MTDDIALIIGSSGFIGSRLVRYLQKSGKFKLIRGLDRSPQTQSTTGIEYHQHDARHPIPDELGQGVTVIYNFAAVHRTPGHPPHEYYDTNVGGALNVAAFATRCGIRSIVFTSSISTYGPSEVTLTEASPLRPISDYGRSKRFAEQIHEQWLRQSEDRKLVIVRPGVIFGPGEKGNYTSLMAALRRGLFFYPGRTDAIKSGGYVDDLVQAIEFARARTERITYFNYAFPVLSTTKDIVEAASFVAGFKASYPTVPAGLLFLAALPFEVANAIGLRNPIHRDRVRKLIQSTAVYPEWLVANGYPFSVDLKGALDAWKAESNGKFI